MRRVVVALVAFAAFACCGDIAGAAVAPDGTAAPFAVEQLSTGPGPRFAHAGIPPGVETMTTHPGGDLAPGLYDRTAFADDVYAPCGVAIFRSSLPAFHSTCSQHAQRPLVAFSTVGGTGRCYGGAGVSNGHYVLWASTVNGSSDAVRVDAGDASIADSVLRTYSCSADDHNDALQAYGTDGATLVEVIHSDLDARPVNDTNVAGNAAVFAADGATGRMVLDQNVFAGGAYTVGLHESMTYVVTDNIWAANTALYGYVNVTAGATVETWSGNRLSDGTPLEP